MKLRVCAALLLASSLAHGGEGMWTPDQLSEIATPLKEAGLELDPAQFADLSGSPMGAIVSLGGCSASFVSPDGLVVTNHHCAYGSIQLNSTEQNNRLRDGIYAATRADELSAGPAARIFVTEEIRDVTRDVLKGLTPRMSDRQRYDAVDAAKKKLVASCESKPGARCNVGSFFGGVVYRLMVQMEIRDVRIVYAPPVAIGKFGGDVDNWSWPRHTGDFAFYRAYVGKDGKPADFAADNVPYRPKHYLPISKQALRDGDFVMVAGYPGTTARYRLADEIDAVIDWTYPKQIARLDALIGLVAEAAPAGSDVSIKYASTVSSWQNGRKNNAGQLAGFASADASGQKQREEAALEQWLSNKGADGQSALRELKALRAHLASARATRDRDLVIATLNSSGLFATARTLHRLSAERARTDSQREVGFQARDWSRIEAGLRQLDRRMDPSVDRKILRYALTEYQALSAEQRLPELDSWLASRPNTGDDDQLERALDALYAGTRLVESQARLDMFTAQRQALEASDDTFIKLAIQLAPALQRIEDQRKSYEGGLLRLQPTYMQAMMDFRRSQGLATYPDANGTLRITFGSVGGVDARDGLRYVPFTTTAGIAAKHTGSDPFDATAPQLAAIEAGARAVPVNFLADLDVTGGNSGSATLNAKGELVGLIFDMTWESVASNWVFDPALTRTIHVDSRYMHWVMSDVYPAPSVLRELGLRNAE